MRSSTLALVGLTLCFPALQYARDAAVPTDAQSNQPVSTDNAVSANSQEGLLSRWLDVNTLSFGMRYRSTYDSNNSHLFDYGQQRSLVDGRLKLDKEGKYSVNFHLSSGRYFNWAYSDEIGSSFQTSSSASISRFTPAETAFFYRTVATDPFVSTVIGHVFSRGWEMYFRQLYFRAAPVKQLSMEWGSLGIERGANTEMTTYDDDGYLAGGRVRLTDPEHLFFDQMAVTYGYVGDIFVPNFLDRGERLEQSNYHQFLLEKKVGKRLVTSVDWTDHVRTHTWREAVLVKTPEARVVDSLRAELYQRTNDVAVAGITIGSGSGFGVTAAKNLGKRWHVEGGFASIDKNYPIYTGSSFMVAVGHSINGDAYAIGNRFFGRVKYAPTTFVSLVGFYTHDFDTSFMTLNKETLQAGFEFDVKNLLNEKFHLF